MNAAVCISARCHGPLLGELHHTIDCESEYGETEGPHLMHKSLERGLFYSWQLITQDNMQNIFHAKWSK